MQKFVFWTGIYNILLGVGFLIPSIPSLSGIQGTNSLFWLWLPAVLVIYLGVLLILCSRNLNVRGTLVYWEGILRVFAFLLLAYFGFWGGLGIMLGVIGIVDLLIGLGYLIGLPRALNT
ncbi:MAG: hypothetical protein WA896_01815, partial [Spirulinaceae cyanobacterium]